ncbi:MAG: hypothetical protein ACYS8K_00865 [Planctomycetota bacterium]
MPAGQSYERRASAEEAREGRLMVLKSRLPFFPPLGRPFEIRQGRSSRTARVESRPCACRGPDRPHEHYCIRWPGLKAGDRMTIRRADGGYTASARKSRPV